MKSPLKIAHRGYCEHHNANTLGAFNAALAHNFDMFEMDIQLDKHDNIILMHDTFIDNKEVREMEYSELKKTMPDLLLLSDFFEKFEYTKVRVYLDLKGSVELAHVLHRLLVFMNIDTTKIWFASFNMNHIDILSAYNWYNCDYKLGYLTGNIVTSDVLRYITDKYLLKFVCFHWTMLDADTIKQLHKNHVLVYCYTLDSKGILDYSNKFEVDGIVSDILF